jgi:Putative Ig domain
MPLLFTSLLPGHGGFLTAPLEITGIPGLALLGQLYTFVPHVLGGRPPYAFTLAEGTLADGLTLDADTGEISGTPAEEGNFSGLILRVTDADSRTDDLGPFALTVEAEAPVYEISGEPNASGTSGSTRNFQAGNILAQRYTTGHAGKIVSLSAYFHGTGTPDFRMSLYSDSTALPGALLAYVNGAASGAQGWHEYPLAPEDYVDVAADRIVWIAAETSANIDSRSPNAVANLARRLRAIAFASGPPDPFSTSSTYSNTRGMRMKIWTNPPG